MEILRVLILACIATSACNPCVGVSGACVTVQVEGSGSVDQMAITINGDASNQKTVPPRPKALSLPQTFALGVNSGLPTSIAVMAYLHGNLIGQAATAVSGSSGESVNVSLQLCQGTAPALCGDQCIADVSKVSSCAPTPPPTVSTGSSGGDLSGGSGSSGSSNGSSSSGGSTGGSTSNVTTLASGQGFPGALTVSDTDIFWVAGPAGQPLPTQIMKVAKAGGRAAQFAASPAETARYAAMVTDSANLYVAGGGSLTSFPLTGATGTPLSTSTVGTTQNYGMGGIGVDATSVYWLAGDSQNDVSLLSVPKIGGPVQPLASIQANNPPSGPNLAVGGGLVFWTGHAQPVGSSSYQATSCVSNLVTNSTAFFCISGSTTIYSWVFSSAAAGTINTNGSALCGLAVTDDSIYWATSAGILKTPVAGGQTSSVASLGACPSSMVVDDTYVFWTDSSDGTVMRVPR